MDPRVRRTKDLFEAALLDLMEEKEYDKISVQEIARKSTLNRATFYLHYYDKNELLQQLLDKAIKELEESIKVQAFEFTYKYDEPHPTFIRLFEKMMERSRFYKIMLAEEKVPYFTERVVKIIEIFVRNGIQQMEQDGIEFTIPKEISVAYGSSAILGVIIWWLKNDMPYTPKYMSSQLTLTSTIGPYVRSPYV